MRARAYRFDADACPLDDGSDFQILGASLNATLKDATIRTRVLALNYNTIAAYCDDVHGMNCACRAEPGNEEWGSSPGAGPLT